MVLLRGLRWDGKAVERLNGRVTSVHTVPESLAAKVAKTGRTSSRSLCQSTCHVLPFNSTP